MRLNLFLGFQGTVMLMTMLYHTLLVFQSGKVLSIVTGDNDDSLMIDEFTPRVNQSPPDQTLTHSDTHSLTHMQDHPAILAAYINKDAWQGKSISDELVDRRGRVKITSVINWFLRGRGPLASTGCDHGALINTRGMNFS